MVITTPHPDIPTPPISLKSHKIPGIRHVPMDLSPPPRSRSANGIFWAPPGVLQLQGWEVWAGTAGHSWPELQEGGRAAFVSPSCPHCAAPRATKRGKWEMALGTSKRGVRWGKKDQKNRKIKPKQTPKANPGGEENPGFIRNGRK